MTLQEASALYRAEKQKRRQQQPDPTMHDWQAIGHRLIDVDTHKLRPDAFLKGHSSG